MFIIITIGIGISFIVHSVVFTIFLTVFFIMLISRIMFTGTHRRSADVAKIGAENFG